MRGLELDGDKAALGTWLADFASGLGDQGLATRAATFALLQEKSLTAYLRVQELAGDEWLGRREDLLGKLRETTDYHLHGAIDIFLHEGLVNDAVALLDRSPYAGATVIRQVAATAIETHPDWVIRKSRQHAEAIMDKGKSGAYAEAADWLSLASQACLDSGREAEWQDYLTGLREQHRRKHTLMPLLKALP